MRRHTLTAVIALMSGALVALELAWTRIFSAEFFYSFAFLILSLAILGLGLGALALRLWPALDRRGTPAVALTTAGLAALAGPLLVFRLGLDFSRLVTDLGMAARLLAAILLLGSAFFAGGIALALLFRRHHADMPRLYRADLLGAAAGVFVVIAAMNGLGTPAATVLTALPLLAAAALAGQGAWRLLPVPVAVAALLLVGPAPDLLRVDRPERAPVIYEHWDAMAKIKVYDFGEDYRGLNIDNVANSPVFGFGGDFEDPELEEAEWAIDVSWLVDRFDGCRFLSLGAGGGGDVLQALAVGAREVYAVEVNPHINRMMVEGDPEGYLSRPRLPATDGTQEARADADGAAAAAGTEAPITCAAFSGNLYRDPRVRVVSEDGRSFVRRHPESFDLIYSLSSNTWAALGSGAFAFAESYLFTREAFEDYWRALSDEGFLSLEHQVYMPRLVAAALDALERMGVEDPSAHLAIYDLPKMRRNLMLLSKQPLTEEVRRNAYGALAPERFEDIHLLWPPAEGTEGNLVHRIVTEGWEQVYPEAELDISPPTDDRPFVAQLGRWKNFDLSALEKRAEIAEFRGFPLSTTIILAILAVVLLLVVPLNLLPFVVGDQRMAPAPWLYFFAIGVAFMFVEVVLMQKYALFIGASVWSIATVLLVLLLASGLGSRLSPRVSDRTAFLAIAAGTAAHALLGGPLTGLLSGLPLAGRLAVVAALVAPLGFFMGMPFPKGARAVGPLIDWGFAVNGAASVIGATSVVLVAFHWGFTVALGLAAVLYLVAWRLLAASGDAAGEASGGASYEPASERPARAVEA